MKAKSLVLVSVFCAVYVTLTLVLAPISYGPVQCRVADALYPLIAVFGWPALIGLSLGQLLANTASPLGVIDLLSPLLFLPAKYLIQRFGIKATPFHVLSVMLWVPYMLHALFGLPYWITVFYVGVGESVAELLIGMPLAIAIRQRHMWFSTVGWE